MRRPPLFLIPAALLYASYLAYLAYGLVHGVIYTTLFCLPGYAAMFIYSLARLRTAQQKLLLLGAATVLEALATLLAMHAGYSPLAGRGVMLGLLTVALLWRQAARQQWRDRAATVDLVWFMLLQVFLIFSNTVVQAAAFLPYTVDRQLYAMDLSFGFNVPALLAMYIGRHPLVAVLARIAYATPAGVLVLAYAIERTKPATPVNILEAFMLASMLSVLYFVAPACGPAAIFGHDFPYTLPAAGSGNFPLCGNVELPRNAMPSLHMLWALLLCLNACLFYPLFYACFFMLFAALTLIATMASGEHYFIDLVVAVPLAVMVYGMAFKRLPLSHGARFHAMAGGAGIAGLWLGMLVLTTARMQAIWAWTAVMVTVILSCWLLRRLIVSYKRTVLNADHPSPYPPHQPA